MLKNVCCIEGTVVPQCYSAFYYTTYSNKIITWLPISNDISSLKLWVSGRKVTEPFYHARELALFDHLLPKKVSRRERGKKDEEDYEIKLKKNALDEKRWIRNEQKRIRRRFLSLVASCVWPTDELIWGNELDIVKFGRVVRFHH